MARLLFLFIGYLMFGFILVAGMLMNGSFIVKLAAGAFLTFLVLLLIEEFIKWRRQKRMKEMERNLY